MSSLLEKVVKTLAPGYTIEPITMIRKEGTECPGHLVTSADGKFKARVFAGAEVGREWRNPNIVPMPRRLTLKPDGVALVKLPDGVEIAA